MAGTGRKVWAADEILAAADLQSYIQDQVVFVFNDAAARTSGILAPSEGMVSYLKDTNLLYAFDGAAWVEIAPNVGTPGTYTKVTTDSKGRVSSGTTLAESDIPTLSISKTSGLQTALDGKAATVHTHTVAQVNGGTWTGPVSAGANGVSGAGLSFTSSLGLNDGTNWRVAGNGSMYVGDGIQNPWAYNNTTGASNYRTLWVGDNGVFGYQPSTIRAKQDVVDTALTADAVVGMRVVDYRMIDDVEANGKKASVRTGLIAEELLEIPGMEKFVFFDEVDGKQIPAGIHYELLAVALIPAIQAQQSVIDSLVARVEMLESK